MLRWIEDSLLKYVCNTHWLLYICCVNSLKAVGSRIEVRGLMSFHGNGIRVGDTAAIYLTSLAQIELFQGAQLHFEGNTGL